MDLDEDILNYILIHVSNTHYHMAKLVQKMYGNIFRPVLHPKNSQKFIWQECINNVWKDMPQAIELHRRIIDEILPYIHMAKSIVKKRGNEATNEIEREYESLKLKELYKLEGNLQLVTFRNHIIKECEYLFYKK
jgi:hypothetical protein